MTILLNGQSVDLPAACSVAALIERLRYANRRLAVELNGEIVPRSEHDNVVLTESDRVEIVQAIGGG